MSVPAPDRSPSAGSEDGQRGASGSEPATIVLRPMGTADVDALMAYEDELFGSESWTADSYRAELADSRYRHYLVAERIAESTAESTAESMAESMAEHAAEGSPEGGPGGVTGRAAVSTATLIGWAGLMVIGETAQILTIGVVPSEQRRGTGQAMLDALLAEARRRRATEVVLEVRVDNAAARRLYERNRFAPLRVRRGYYDLGRVDAVEMKREL